MPNLTVGTIVMQDRASVLLGKVSDGRLTTYIDAGLWAIPDGVVNEGETIRDACIRTVKEATGLDVEPRMTLFLCERVVEGDHRIGIFVLAEPTNTGIVPSERYSEIKWVDVRELGNLQKNEGMSDFTADAFVKFSVFLQQQAPKAASPVSGTVN